MSVRIVELAAMTAMVAGTMIAGTVMPPKLAAETHKQYRFNVGPHSGISINNPYGSISAKPSSGNFVVISAVLSSDKVEVDNNVSSDRVEVLSHLLPGADAQSGRVDYEILVPADASLTLHSSAGTLRAEKLHGDITLEGASASVDVFCHEAPGSRGQKTAATIRPNQICYKERFETTATVALRSLALPT